MEILRRLLRIFFLDFFFQLYRFGIVVDLVVSEASEMISEGCQNLVMVNRFKFPNYSFKGGVLLRLSLLINKDILVVAQKIVDLFASEVCFEF